MAAMGHDGPSLPFDFKFPFQNKSILIKLNLINKTTNKLGQQMKKYWFRRSIWNVNFDLVFILKIKMKFEITSMIQI